MKIVQHYLKTVDRWGGDIDLFIYPEGSPVHEIWKDTVWKTLEEAETRFPDQRFRTVEVL